MSKITILFLFISTLCLGAVNTNINNKISLNKKILTSKKYQQQTTNIKIKTLAKQIQKQELDYSKIEKKLTNLNTTIFLNRVKLNRVKSQIVTLESQSIDIQKKSLRTQNDMIDEITNRYSASIGVSLAKKPTIKEILDKEIYTLLLEESSDNVLKLNLEYLKSTISTQKNKERTVKLTKYISAQEEEKIKYNKLKIKKKDVLTKLAKQHKSYQNELKTIIKKQQNLQDLLGKLNILQTKEINKEKLKQKELKAKRIKEAKKVAKKKRSKLRKLRKIKTSSPKVTKNKRTEKIKYVKRQLDEEIDMEVRNIGSSTRGVKITKYKGHKTIAPLKSYTVVKNFGKYYDPVYKIELFNEALSMKPKKKNAKVYNVLSGKIVYAKKNSGTLENVVIVQHKGGLHTIYSHLDQIAPTLKIGKWIKKGFVVGRVNGTLMFQATKNSKYINPKDLFK